MKARTASLADCAQLAEMNHQLIRDEGHHNPMTLAELEQRMHGWLTSGEYRAVIFERDSQSLAYALYRIEADDSIFLRQFFVSREHRRQGLGRAAIDLLLLDVLPLGSRIKVEVLTTNEAARRFWSAVGFRDYSLTLERS